MFKIKNYIKHQLFHPFFMALKFGEWHRKTKRTMNCRARSSKMNDKMDSLLLATQETKSFCRNSKWNVQKFHMHKNNCNQLTYDYRFPKQIMHFNPIGRWLWYPIRQLEDVNFKGQNRSFLCARIAQAVNWPAVGWPIVVQFPHVQGFLSVTKVGMALRHIHSPTQWALGLFLVG